jgi:hypothetical protein
MFLLPTPLVLLFASLVSGSDAGEEAGDAPAFALQTAVPSNGSKPRLVLMPRCFSIFLVAHAVLVSIFHRSEIVQK